MLPEIVATAGVGSVIDLTLRAPGIGPEVARDDIHLHRTGNPPPGRWPRRRAVALTRYRGWLDSCTSASMTRARAAVSLRIR